MFLPLLLAQYSAASARLLSLGGGLASSGHEPMPALTVTRWSGRIRLRAIAVRIRSATSSASI